MTWIAPDVERSEDYPARRNEPEREILRDWLDWHRASGAQMRGTGRQAHRAASNLSLLGLVRHMSDAERGWVRQLFHGEQVPDLYYRSDARTPTSKRQYARHNGHADLLREAIDGSADRHSAKPAGVPVFVLPLPGAAA